MTSLHGAAALARARSLAVPVASCAAAAIGSGHLTDGLSRDELLALVAVLAEAADPVAVRDLVRDPAARRRDPDPEGRAALLRAAHAEAEACRKGGLPVPPHTAALEREYWRNRKRAQQDAAAEAMAREAREEADRAAAEAQMVLLEPCPSLAAYRRHRRRDEDPEACGCLDAARAMWRARKRRTARDAGPEPAVREQSDAAA